MLPFFFKFQFAGQCPVTIRAWQAGNIRYTIGPTRFDTAEQISVYRSVSYLMIRVTFLCPHKKVTKEVSIGEALTAKSIGTSSINRRFCPAFEPICSSVIAPGNH